MTHVPGPMNDTVEPASEQTLAALASIERLTERPELAVALTVYVPPTCALAGAVEVNEIVCVALPTANGCRTCGAAADVALPALFGSKAHVAGPMNETGEPVIEHTEVAVASMVRLTG